MLAEIAIKTMLVVADLERKDDNLVLINVKRELGGRMEDT